MHKQLFRWRRRSNARLRKAKMATERPYVPAAYYTDLVWVAQSHNVTKPYEFIGFGAVDVTKPYEFIGFGDIHAG